MRPPLISLLSLLLLISGVIVAAALCGYPTSSAQAGLSHADLIHLQTNAAPQSLTDTPLPGMPPLINAKDVYAADRPNRLSVTVRDFPTRIYVPNTESNSVDVIDPATFRI